MKRQKRRKVLFITQVLPYPCNSGPQLRAYYVLRQIAQSYAVTLVSFIRSKDQLEHVPHLSSFCEAVYPIIRTNSLRQELRALLQSQVTGIPFMILRHQRGPMRALIHHLLETHAFDLIHVDQMIMGQYVAQSNSCVKVIDKHNAYSEIIKGVRHGQGSGLQRLIAMLEYPKLRRYEGSLLGKFDGIIAVTEDDRATMRKWMSVERPMEVIPICTDPSNVRAIRRAPQAGDILNVGSMFYPPNVDGALWFCKEILPLLRTRQPDADAWFVGSRPANALRKLSSSHPGIHVTGYVQDLRPFLKRSAVFIVPLRYGAGMRVKILDALAWGIPIVSTTFGAQGIDVRSEESVLLADTPEEFADAVARIRTDSDLSRKLVANGRRLLETRYDWRAVYPRFEGLYDRMLTPSSGSIRSHATEAGVVER